MRAGRMPTLDRLVREGDSRVDPWFALLPPVTPVSQAGILHGNNDDMPGFRWFEKRSKTLLVANTPGWRVGDPAPPSDGQGLLVGRRRQHRQPADRRRDAQLPDDGHDRGQAGPRRSAAAPRHLREPGQLHPAGGPDRRRDRQGAVPARAPASPGRPAAHRSRRSALRLRARRDERVPAQSHDRTRHRGDVRPSAPVDLRRLHRATTRSPTTPVPSGRSRWMRSMASIGRSAAC